MEIVVNEPEIGQCLMFGIKTKIFSICLRQIQQILNDVRSDVPAAVVMKTSIFWDIMPCIPSSDLYYIFLSIKLSTNRSRSLLKLPSILKLSYYHVFSDYTRGFDWQLDLLDSYNS
jgi:hypothetical protein